MIIQRRIFRRRRHGARVSMEFFLKKIVDGLAFFGKEGILNTFHDNLDDFA